jgi:hypothetical protein
MKNKALTIGIFFLAIATNIAAYAVRHPLETGFCRETYMFDGIERCSDDIVSTVGDPLQIFAGSFLLISFVLLFVRKKIVFSWMKFSLIWLATSFYFISKTPVDSGAWAISFDRNYVSAMMMSLFVLISLILIVYKSLKLRRLDSAYRQDAV